MFGQEMGLHADSRIAAFMCGEKRPALCVVNLYLLLGQLDVHLLSDELRRNAVAMSPAGPAQPDAMAFVHGVDLPFAMFIGTIRQRLQAAPFLFFETGPASGISSLPLTQVEFVQVFENCFKLPKWNVFSLKSERGLLAPPSGFIPRKVLASKLGGGLNQRSP